jgi:EAL domain-containing protein (putative c-di-GMP-specific phosphodiesterase class I)
LSTLPSLRYLEAFPISEVKLDRVFIHALHESRTRQVIVDGMIRLGHELGIDVVAEGVETEEELATLRKLGCALGQGYLFGAPVPAADFIELIKRGGKTVAD